mmetsp:Transcript_28420/g.111470  ORF Transcript_28420/g.111470 Transcript_28420/m.111470 type:complete len:81 (+) Transcript_28420:116-358(+)
MVSSIVLFEVHTSRSSVDGEQGRAESGKGGRRARRVQVISKHETLKRLNEDRELQLCKNLGKIGFKSCPAGLPRGRFGWR